MPTRRNLILGVGNLLLGSAAITNGAFNPLVTPEADMRIIADAAGGRLKLKPGRHDETYVTTDQDGYVEEISLDGLGVAGDGVNRSAETRFERLVILCNQPPGPPIEELYFEFEVTDEGLDATDPTPAEIESVLFVASAGGDILGEGTTDFLDATNHGQTGADNLTPNEELPFGIGIDLLPGSQIQDLPEPANFTVTLRIEATVTGSGQSGNPGGGPPGNSGN
jgi:hypothetical protein